MKSSPACQGHFLTTAFSHSGGKFVLPPQGIPDIISIIVYEYRSRQAIIAGSRSAFTTFPEAGKKSGRSVTASLLHGIARKKKGRNHQHQTYPCVRCDRHYRTIHYSKCLRHEVTFLFWSISMSRALLIFFTLAIRGRTRLVSPSSCYAPSVTGGISR